MSLKSFLKILFSIAIIISLQKSFATGTSSAKIIYEQFENDKLQKDKIITVICNSNTTSISNSSATNENYFVDYAARNTVKTGTFNQKNYSVFTSFDSLPKPTTTNDTATILGFLCKKITYNIFSNSVEVWFTTQSKFKATPSMNIVPDGLVLKYVMNGSRKIIAKSISIIETNKEISSSKNSVKVSDAEYAAIQIQSRFTAISVFQKEQINFDDKWKNEKATQSNITYHFAKGNVILKKIKLPEHSSNGSFFVKVTDWSNGDAYDRVGSVFTFSAAKQKSMLDAFENGLQAIPFFTDRNGEHYQGAIATVDYAPSIELMRFFTSFGVNYFNKKRIIKGYDWADSVIYKQDVTSLISSEEKEIWLGVYIGNYDKGGHKVSLELDFYPEEEMSETKKFIASLFSTVNILEAAGQNYGKLFLNDSLKMNFEINDSITDLTMLYTTTGHGGWGGGDEFNPKLNQIFVDGKLVFAATPWRTDCGTYRLLNPASGNFPDGLSSSDFSRSNWCPGTLTTPYLIPLKKLSLGKHTLQVAIDEGKNEAGSFSHWCVSGVLVGTKK